MVRCYPDLGYNNLTVARGEQSFVIRRWYPVPEVTKLHVHMCVVVIGKAMVK